MDIVGKRPTVFCCWCHSLTDFTTNGPVTVPADTAELGRRRSAGEFIADGICRECYKKKMKELELKN